MFFCMKYPSTFILCMCKQEGSGETVCLYNLTEVIAGGIHDRFLFYLNCLTYMLMI